MRIVAPTDGLGALAIESRAVKATASLLRWTCACAVAFAGLLLVSIALASFERTGAAEPAQTSASAYLDFDLSVLRALADRSLRGERPLLSMWAHRPDWQLSPARAASVRLVSVRDAWAAVTSEKSHFRTAARGAADALPFLLAGLALSLLAAAAAGALALVPRWAPLGAALVVYPAWRLLDAAVFYDRTRSPGLGLSAALFVAAFAGAMSGAAARALFARSAQARYLSALGRRPALLAAARIAVLDSAAWLIPLVPALAAAAVFVCAKADQDPSVAAQASGLGSLIRAAMLEPGAGDRLASCALVAGALVVLWFLGHRFVVEVSEALR
jgi:hypothetical protein